MSDSHLVDVCGVWEASNLLDFWRPFSESDDGALVIREVPRADWPGPGEISSLTRMFASMITVVVAQFLAMKDGPE